MGVKVIRASLFGLGVAAMVLSVTGQVLASPTVPLVPEIDGGSIAAGFAALSSAALILRSRLRK